MLQQNSKVAHPLLFRFTQPREVEMEVVFGTPSKNCSGAGICLIAGRFDEGQKIECPHAPALIHYLPSSELVFRFRKRHLSHTLLCSYFNKNHFLVEESFSLPMQLVRQWNLPLNRIPAGRYQMEEYSQEWRLYIPFNF